MPENLENSAVATRLEKVSFHSNSKERQWQRMFKLTTQLHSFHVLTRLCSESFKLCFTVNLKLPDVHAGFRKGKGTRDQIANIRWYMEKAREFQKNISALLTMSKPLTVWITINWEILKEMGIPDHLTCLLRNLYAGQEVTVRIGHGTTDWTPNQKRSTSRLYIVTLLISIICRVHHEKHRAGRHISWNQDCREKYQ